MEVQTARWGGGGVSLDESIVVSLVAIVVKTH